MTDTECMETREEFCKRQLDTLRKALDLYLCVDDECIMEGAEPMHKEVRELVDATMHAIARIEDSDHVQHCAWPQCVQECKSKGLQFTTACQTGYNLHEGHTCPNCSKYRQGIQT